MVYAAPQRHRRQSQHEKRVFTRSRRFARLAGRDCGSVAADGVWLETGGSDCEPAGVAADCTQRAGRAERHPAYFDARRAPTYRPSRASGRNPRRATGVGRARFACVDAHQRSPSVFRPSGFGWHDDSWRSAKRTSSGGALNPSQRHRARYLAAGRAKPSARRGFVLQRR